MSTWSRRTFVQASGALLAGAALAACGSSPEARQSPEGRRQADRARPPAAPATPQAPGAWGEVRAQFDLDPALIHLGALYIASHPRPVREAIARHREGLDRDPVGYIDATNRRALDRVRERAAEYLGASPAEVALTRSTTEGVGMVYNGLRLREGDELLTTEDDYYVTHESLRLAAARSGAAVRRVPLFDEPGTATVDGLVQALAGAVTARTRLVALTWVHSGTGLKLPMPQVAQALREAAGDRPEDRRLLVGLDGVHGFGTEDATPADLGVDFFMAGCHKWMFGPRGTGVLWAPERNWQYLEPTVPSFTDDESWFAWIDRREPAVTTATAMSPGGFHAFEHRWALAEAFEFHAGVGRERISARTHELARRCKEGLRGMRHVTLWTPMEPELSSGIVCFEVAGLDPSTAVARLDERGIRATVTPYARVLVRFGPSILNTPEEIDRALEAVDALG